MQAIGPTAATYRASAAVVAPGVAIAKVKEGTIEFDVSRTAGADLPGPAELLALSLGACLLKNVERFSHLLSFRYEGASVRVEADRQERPPRFTALRYELRIRTDENDHRVELLRRNLERSGTVFNTLAAACPIEGRILAGPDVAPAFDRPVPDPLQSHACC
ncbi:MAG TPA: OsmC family protein [Actinomycetota bacterium]